MLRTLLLPAWLLLLFSVASAQGIVIKGALQDTTEKRTLKLASIALLRSTDSVLLTFTRSGANGEFSLKAKPGQSYLLLISYPGYADHVDLLKPDKDTDLGEINMLTKAVLLQNVVVRGSAIRMKGDTLAFVADSFKVREGATVEDLLKRLPGLSVNSKGEITAQGQRVQRVLVDGDEFFGDDPTLATRNIQAEAIKEVQVFDRKTDQATFTGVDDGQAQKTINLKLKDEFKRGYFGKANLGGGLPTRYENQAMINAFKDKRRISVYGIASNTNQSSLGWSEEEQFGGQIGITTEISDDGGIMMWRGGDEFGGVGGYQGEGLPTAFTLGGSYANKWNAARSNVLGAYRFQQLRTEAVSSNRTQYILPDTQYFNNQQGKNLASRWRHKLVARSELFIDSMQSFIFNLNGSVGRSEISNQFTSEALSADGLPVNTSQRSTNATTQTAQYNLNALYKLKFRKKGRTFSANLTQTYSENFSDGFLLTYNEFFVKGLSVSKDTVDQKKENDTKASTYGLRLTYTEPIGKNALVEVNYGYSFSNSRQKRLSFDEQDGKYDLLNTTFSNDFKFKNEVNRTGAAYRYNGKKLQFGFGGDVAFTQWQQNDLFRDTALLLDFINFFPRANLSYKLGQYSRIRFTYNGNTQAPTANQLQPVADNNDPLNIFIGNPSLQQSFNHRFEFGYNFYEVIKGRGLWTSIWLNPTANAFSTRDFVDSVGRKIYQTVNVNGNYSLGTYMGYNFLWKKPNVRLDFQFIPNISRRTNFVNGVENRTQSNNWTFGLGASKQQEEVFDVYLNADVSYITSSSSIRPDVITRYWTSSASLEGNVRFLKKYSISNEFDFNWRQRTEVFPDNNNVLLWAISIDRKISKKQDMRAGFRVNDLVNQNLGFRRNVSSNFVSEQTYNVIRRFWLLTFVWNFNKGPQKAE